MRPNVKAQAGASAPVGRSRKPATPAPPPLSPAGRAIAGRGHGRKVLVVDADPVRRELARAHLALEGFEVMCARDGAEALRRARGEPAGPMARTTPGPWTETPAGPPLRGPELYLALRREPALAGVAVVIWSSN